MSVPCGISASWVEKVFYGLWLLSLFRNYFVDKKCEIDPIKNTIEAESSKKTEVSMTQFLCFTGRPCFYYPLLSRLKKKAKLVETLLATVS